MQRELNLSSYGGYKEVLIESAGTRIALSIYESEKTSPVVIFLPGTMTHPLFFDEFLSVVAKNGYNVIGVHFISHGKSPREKSKYVFDDMLVNVRDTISYATEFYNDNIALLGSSQGGILSLAAATVETKLKAVFAHNVLLPTLRSSIEITRFPSWLKHFYGIIRSSFKLMGKIAPGYQMAFESYLDPDRVFSDDHLKKCFYQDPIGLTKYPMIFMSSLFSADLSGIEDGSIKCPVTVIASKGDTLFPFDYCMNVYERIVAPKKELLVFDEPHHLIFNECIDRITPGIMDTMNGLMKN